MKIKRTSSLAIPEVKTVVFERFHDERGYFTETYRKSDLLDGIEVVQSNQNYSKKGVLRGLHFQWNPYMGKLVRVIKGRMIDLILDIRKNSPTFGKLIMYVMDEWDENARGDEWIWIPPGFAHGNYYLENSLIEYFCTGEYNSDCEAGISPLSKDIDTSLLHGSQMLFYDKIIESTNISTKDRNGLTVGEWEKDKRSENFIYDM